MDENDILVWNARFFVLRMLIMEMAEQIAFTDDDPVERVRRWEATVLAGMDQAIDASTMPDIFKHTALHEMETFWQGLRGAVARRVQARL